MTKNLRKPHHYTYTILHGIYTLVIYWFCVQVFPDLSKINETNSLLLNDQNKYRSMWIRAYSSLWMLLGFAVTLYLGHLYICAMILLIQILMVTELFNLLRRAHEDRCLPGFRLLNWWEKHWSWMFWGWYSLWHVISQAFFLDGNAVCVRTYPQSAACEHCNIWQILL